MYPSLAVANKFIELAKRDNIPISNMKLQKLVYLAHGFFLATKQIPLVNETIEAWDYGPVIPSLYNSFRQYGFGNIPDEVSTVEVKDGRWKFFRPKIDDGDKSTSYLIHVVWDAYKDFSAIQLANLTHEHGSPWHQTILPFTSSLQPIPRGLEIGNTLIQEYYTAKLRSSSSKGHE